jgi:hypothetical protein
MLLGHYLPVATTAWLLGVVLSSVYHVTGYARLRRLARRARVLSDPFWVERIRQLGILVGVRKGIRIVTVAKAAGPAVIGCLKPVLLLPVSFFSGMDTAYVEALLLHELAHVRRFDYLFNLFQITVEILGFFHPAVWWLSRTIRREREHCCDDIAVAATGDRLIYARSLVYLEERRLAPTLMMTANGGDLFQRVARIVGHRTHASSFVNAGGFVVASLAVVLLAAFTWTTGAGSMPGSREESCAIVKRLSSRLVAFFPFDGNSHDASGFGQHGLVKGAVPCEDRSGRPGCAYDFNGKDGCIAIPSGSALNAAASLTVCCWVYPRRCGNYESWISKTSGNHTNSVWRAGFGEKKNTEWGLTEWRANNAMGIWNDYWVERGEVPLHVWSCVTAVADQEKREVRLYVNGRRIAEIGGLHPFENSDGTLVVGRQGDDNAYFDGKVDDIRIYDMALNDREVAALYAL